MKKILSILVAAALLCVSTAGTASARARVRFPWEGAVIALGTVGLLAALSQADAFADTGYAAPAPPPRPGDGWGPGYRPDDRDDRDDRHDRFAPGEPYGRHDRDGYRGRVRVPGYWATVRVWVPGGWRQVGEPEWRDGRGRWIPGRSVRRPAPGWYEARRVWREGYCR